MTVHRWGLHLDYSGRRREDTDRRVRVMRMTLRRPDGAVYMRRWGVELARPNVGGVYLHRFTAGDPGVDLHDHPWTFASVILRGGYVEERANIREATGLARLAARWPDRGMRRGVEGTWRAPSVHWVRLDECHRITSLTGPVCWTLVLRGPRRRRWGFYPPAPGGWVDERFYDLARRDLVADEEEHASDDAIRPRRGWSIPDVRAEQRR